MKFMELLRKLGILRYGAETKVYRNAKERPLSFQMGEAFYMGKDEAKSDKPAKDTDKAKE